MILVDYRAGSIDLLPLLPPDLAKKHVLEAGDVAFFGHGPDGPYTYPIGIEYKTAKEALQCMHSGRLVGHQLPEMSKLYQRIYLLIEGEYKEGSKGELLFKGWKDKKPVWSSFSNATYRQFDNWMNSITEIGHVVFKRSMTRVESATQVLNLFYLWTKDYESHKACFKFSSANIPPTLVKPSLTRKIAAQIPSVGWELSGRAAKKFDNPIALVTAPEEEWATIQGIGKKMAAKIVSALNQE